MIVETLFLGDNQADCNHLRLVDDDNTQMVQVTLRDAICWSPLEPKKMAIVLLPIVVNVTIIIDHHYWTIRSLLSSICLPK